MYKSFFSKSCLSKKNAFWKFSVLILLRAPALVLFIALSGSSIVNGKKHTLNGTSIDDDKNQTLNGTINFHKLKAEIVTSYWPVKPYH